MAPCTLTHVPTEDTTMSDVVSVALTIAFFVVAALYVAFCDRVR
ncbi:MAG TPA: hypothetical protein VHE61_15670 [Opitutaceae bacterium]|nr:hypothetical protein [Opitutaceae bacterium]